MARVFYHSCSYPCIFNRILVIGIRGAYEVVIRDLGFPCQFLLDVSGVYDWLQEAPRHIRTLKTSAPLSQNSLGSTPAFADARCT
jgi:hypothetical protein